MAYIYNSMEWVQPPKPGEVVGIREGSSITFEAKVNGPNYVYNGSLWYKLPDKTIWDEAKGLKHTFTVTKEWSGRIYYFRSHFYPNNTQSLGYQSCDTSKIKLDVYYKPSCTGIQFWNYMSKEKTIDSCVGREGDTINLSLAGFKAGNPSDTIYNWQYSLNGKTWNTCYGGTKASTDITLGKEPKMIIRCQYTNAQYQSEGLTTKETTLVIYRKPTITKSPESQTVRVGAPVSFSISADPGHPSDILYGWHYKPPGADAWTAIPGATSSTYSLTAMPERNGYLYCCMVGNEKFPVGSPENFGHAAQLTVYERLQNPTELKIKDIVSVSSTSIFWKRPPDEIENSVTGFAISYVIKKTGSSTISEIKPLVKSGAVESYTVDLTSLGLDFGDVVSFYIQAIGSQSPDGDSEIVEFPATIMYGGILHIRRGGEWLPAIPYIKINGEWKIAVPYVKHGGAWKMTG